MQVPTEWERSPGLWRRVLERAWSWGVTCPLPWTASSPPMWWSGSSSECLSPSSSTSASTLLMWTQSTLVRRGGGQSRIIHLWKYAETSRIKGFVSTRFWICGDMICLGINKDEVVFFIWLFVFLWGSQMTVYAAADAELSTEFHAAF